MSRQLALPESDVFNGSTFPQQWLRQLDNGTTNLFEMLSETVYGSPSPNDNIYAPTNFDKHFPPVVVFKLSSMVAPPKRFHILFGEDAQVGLLIYTSSYRADGFDGVTSVELQIREDYVDEANQGTLIFSTGRTPTNTTMVTKEERFDGRTVVNWANLYLRIGASIPLAHATDTAGDGMRVGIAFLRMEGAGLQHPNKIDQFPDRASYRSELRILGSTNGTPVIQLINDSPNYKMRVYRLDVWGQINTGGHTGLDRQSAYGIRRTDNPFNPGIGATVTFGNIIRLDPDDVSLLVGVVRGIDFTDEQYHNIVGQTGYEFEDIDDSDGDGIAAIFSQLIVAPSTYPSLRPYRVRPPGGYPWTIMPLSAIEVAWLDNGAARVSHAAFEWDKVTL